MRRLSNSHQPQSIRPRSWSYEALRQVKLWVPVMPGDIRREDRSRIGTIALPLYCPEHGHGMIAPQAPRRNELGVWMYGIAATFNSYYERNPRHARVINTVFAALVEYDAAPRDWKRAARAQASNGQLVVRAIAARRQAEVRRVEAESMLTAFLRHGLERRVGTRLHGEETTWLHLAARGFEHPGLRVCEQCASVFRARRAEKCSSCRRSPVRITLHPYELGGWHVDYRVGRRSQTEEFDRTVHYVTVCQACESRFETTRSNTRLCRNCGSGSGRVRRHRGSISRTGRQRFRFVHAEGAEVWSASFNRLDGRMVLCEAADGVVETDDAEVAAMLVQMANVVAL